MSLRPKQSLNNAWDILRTIKSYKVSSIFQNDNAENVEITNFVFKLHSQVTVYILLLGTILLTYKTTYNPIECLLRENSVLSKSLLEKYCWMEGSFSVYQNYPSNHNKLLKTHGVVGIDYAYPGVTSGPGKRVNHKYYQWVYFVLLLQTILFYLPKYFWRCKEKKFIKNLIYRLQKQIISSYKFQHQKILLQDFFDCLLISENYLTTFIFCEVYFVFNLVLQFWFTDVFLGGSFRNLGWNWLYYTNSETYLDESYDPLVKIFPRLAKCNFHRFDVSGSIVNTDALCFLPLNIINEKIYVTLWLWFLFLFFVTSSYLLFHIVLVYSASLRYLKLRYYAPKCDAKCLKILCKNPGNWFILEFIAVNIKPNYFNVLIKSLFEEFYDLKGKPKINLTMMDKYKNLFEDNYDDTNYFDYINNNNNSNTTHYNVNTNRNSFLTNVSTHTNDFNHLSSILTNSKHVNTLRKPKKKHRSINSSSLINVFNNLNKSDWENQSNQETLPFLQQEDMSENEYLNNEVNFKQNKPNFNNLNIFENSNLKDED